MEDPIMGFFKQYHRSLILTLRLLKRPLVYIHSVTAQIWVDLGLLYYKIHPSIWEVFDKKYDISSTFSDDGCDTVRLIEF